MKLTTTFVTKSQVLLLVALLVFFARSGLAQTPTLGSAADFVLFTSVGAITNTGISQVTGKVGSNVGASTGFGNVNGKMETQNAATAACSTDVVLTYNQLVSATTTSTLSTSLGGDTLLAGVYATIGATTLNNTLTLNAQGNANAVFIFKIEGTFSALVNAKVRLINGALACNVFWKTEGLTSFATGVKMCGNIIVNGAAINFSAGDTLEGRAYTTSGAIDVNNIMAFTPLGCGSPYLTGPATPTLGTTANYVLFSSIGAVTNTGNTYANGDIGSNSAPTTGFNPLHVNGTIHTTPDGSTNTCATDLALVYSYLNGLTADIELLYPAQFGNNLVLTPHTYLLNAATTLTDTLYLNAQGNANAVFIIKIFGALSTSTNANVLLINGTQSKNVFWLVNGATNIIINSVFRGTMVANNGAIEFGSNTILDGRALTTAGALTVANLNAYMPNIPVITAIAPSRAVVGSSITLTGYNFNPLAASNIVYFGSTQATVTAATANSLTVTVPIGAKYGFITELNTASNLMAASLQSFTPIYSPAKVGISPYDFLAKQDFSTGIGSEPNCVAIGDLNGDGKADLAVANAGNSTVSVFINTATSGSINAGSFAAKVDFAVAGAARGISIGDIDGDGKPDIAVACYGSIISVLRNTSSSATLSMAAKVDFATNANANAVSMADLDGDGKSDLIVANTSANNISIFQNNSVVGNISFRTKLDYVTGTAPQSVSVGDIDGDGKVDIVTANSGSNTVSVFLNTASLGAISLASRLDFATGVSPYFVHLADIDGDTLLDLTVANFSSNTVSVFRNTSYLGFIAMAAKVDFATGATPISIAIGDINGDGKADLALANQTANTVSLIRNTSLIGDISFASKVDFATGSGAQSVAICDLDGDEKPDIAIANASSNTVSILRNDDVKIYYSQASGNPATLLNWNSEANGTGVPPVDLIIPTRYIIQNAHTLTTASPLTFGSLGSSLEIQNGGTLTATAGNAIHFVTGSILQIELGAVFNAQTNQSISLLNMVGGKLNIGVGTTLTLNGAVTTTAGVFSGSTSANLVVATQVGNLLFDQSVPGTSNVLQVLTIGLGNDASFTLGNALNIAATGNIHFNAAGSKMITTTGQVLTLKSSALGTANIGNLNGATITGNVAIERYVANTAVRGRWRFLSSSVQGASVANWMTQFYVTGPGDGTTLGAPNTNGWHTNQANIDFPTSGTDNRRVLTTSIRTYAEPEAGNLNIGWNNISATSEALTAGKGYRVFIRGPISGGTSQIGSGANSNIQGAVTLSLSGAINSGNMAMPVLATATGAGSTFDVANDGWNFLGNPYPSAYDWNLGVSSSNVSPIVYVYDATANGYKSYNTLSGGTLTSGIIPMGAAFFVKASGLNPTLTFSEAGKSNTAPIVVHKSAKTDEFSMVYAQDSTEHDEFMLKMIVGSTLNQDDFDIGKLRNENLNLSSYGADSLQVMLTAIPPVNGETQIKLNVEASEVGTYQFKFKNMEHFDKGVTVSLLDKFTQNTIPVTAHTVYTFDMGSGINQWGKNRFVLLLNGKASTQLGELKEASKAWQLVVYPNPANEFIHVKMDASNFSRSEVFVYDISGKEMLQMDMLQNELQLNVASFSSGVYFIRVSNINGLNQTVKFIK
ncbi:MAG: ice-binding family protein [Bacteroidota bacterium]|nr:ice-binding family protein [Bacteroidota bacterium]